MSQTTENRRQARGRGTAAWLAGGVAVLALALPWASGCVRLPVAPDAAATALPVVSAPPEAARAAFEPEGRRGLPNLGLLKKELTAYHDSGEWDADMAEVMARAAAWLASAPPGGGPPALVLDIDETSLSNWPELAQWDFGYTKPAWDDWVMTASAPAVQPTLDLYRYAKGRRLAVFFISARPESQREVTEKNLRAAGYEGWDGLSLQPDDYRDPSKVPFKSEERRKIAGRGFRILANVGDQDSDLAGGYAERTFKLPNPAYYIP